MSEGIRESLKAELVARGFSASLESPAGTLGLTDSYATAADLADLLELMVARREKVFRSVDVVGKDAATKSLGDTILVIEAVKAVLARLTLQAAP